MTLKAELRKTLKKQRLLTKSEKPKEISFIRVRTDKEQKIIDDYITEKLRESAEKGRSECEFDIEDCIPNLSFKLNIFDFENFAEKNNLEIMYTDSNTGQIVSRKICDQIVFV